MNELLNTGYVAFGATNELAEAVNRLLCSLGYTADEVYLSLGVEKVKGSRGNGYTCPIAVYLKKHLPGDPTVGVAKWGVQVRYHNGPRINQEMPDPVKEFVRRFDSRYSGYRSLLAEWDKPE